MLSFNHACAACVQILVPDLGPHVVLNFLLMDYDMIGNDEAMAEYDVPLDKKDEDADFLRDTSESYPKALQLRPVRKKGSVRSSKPHGELKVSLHFTPFFSAEAPAEGAEEDPAKVMEALAVRPSPLSPLPPHPAHHAHMILQLDSPRMLAMCRSQRHSWPGL